MSKAESRWPGRHQPVTAPWGPCPNDPPCPHSGVLHDIYAPDDPQPVCCMDGCDCGIRWTRPEGRQETGVPGDEPGSRVGPG